MCAFIKQTPLVGPGLRNAFATVASLFFLWGFARSLLDVLNRHFQISLGLSVGESAWIQGVTYAAYALTALPAGVLIMKRGYKPGVTAGLLIFAAGCLLFIPGALTASFPFILAALFLIGCGLAALETSANPYIAGLGPKDTSASRLNYAQALNGLGCVLGPVVLGAVVFSGKGHSAALPYGLLGGAVVLLALVFGKTRLPEPGVISVQEVAAKGMPKFPDAVRRLWKNGVFRMGIATLFFYEVAEIGINSLFINYCVATGWLSPLRASALLSFGALVLFMVARVLGGALMRRVNPLKLCALCATLGALCCLAVASSLGMISKIALLGCYIFEAILFPTIFATAVSATESDSKLASAFMMMTPLGGAAGTLAMGYIAAATSVPQAFWVPCVAFVPVTLLASGMCRAIRRAHAG